MSKLKNKVAVITGGNSASGLALPRNLKMKDVNDVIFLAAYVTANAIEAGTFVAQILNKRNNE
ncbi:MAG: hypothetical protein ACXVDZ_14070 [Bacteroidia bacterium]